jgi:hypothetical protein
MTNHPISFVVINEDCPSEANRILVSIKALRDDMNDQGFKTNIESILILGELLSAAEDAAVIAMIERS